MMIVLKMADFFDAVCFPHEKHPIIMNEFCRKHKINK